MDTLIIFGAKYLYLISIAVAAVYFVRESGGKRKRIFIFACFALPIIYIVAKITGIFYYDARPFVVGNFIPLIPHAPDNGFPSDHTLLTSALAAIVTRFNRRTGAVLWLVALLVGASRVAAGIHHPIDIIGAMAISLAVVVALSYFFKKPNAA